MEWDLQAVMHGHAPRDCVKEPSLTAHALYEAETKVGLPRNSMTLFLRLLMNNNPGLYSARVDALSS